MQRSIAIGLASALWLQMAPLSAAPAPLQQTGARRARYTAAVTIDGKAQIANDEGMPTSLQLRNLETGQVVATASFSSRGNFSFAGYRPGRYSVELVNSSGAIVATSAAVTASAGATTSLTVPPVSATAVGRAGAVGTPGVPAAGVSTASIVTTMAVAAGIPGVVVAARPQPSPSF
jgi:hypothetical protein